MDPCEDLSDDDIRTAIHNATGPRSALFVPEVGGLMLILLAIFFVFKKLHGLWLFPYQLIEFLSNSWTPVSVFLCN